MARLHYHEDHVNHEAWAIPYGDLVTLLLAFFVVMYAISSVNEGKFRVLADAMSSAFGGPPRTITPIQLGQTQLRGSSFDRPSMQTPDAKSGPAAASPINAPRMLQVLDLPTFGRPQAAAAQPAAAAVEMVEVEGRKATQLHSLGQRIQDALAELVRKKLVTVRRGRTFLEVEIQSDILFASGVARPSPLAVATVRQLAQVLRAEANAVRVEGYTDDRPIRTAQFPSNWELSAARAGSVVHELIDAGVGAGRLAVVGYGEHQPIADNATAQGRNANRRVLLVILAVPQGADAEPDRGAQIARTGAGHDAGSALATAASGVATGSQASASRSSGAPANTSAATPVEPNATVGAGVVATAATATLAASTPPIAPPAGAG